MIQTNYVPDVWKDLKLEFKEDISSINLDIPLEPNIGILRNLNNSITDKNLLNESSIIKCDKIYDNKLHKKSNEKKETIKRNKRTKSKSLQKIRRSITKTKNA